MLVLSLNCIRATANLLRSKEYGEGALLVRFPFELKLLG
jgi:hypothetical protein